MEKEFLCKTKQVGTRPSGIKVVPLWKPTLTTNTLSKLTGLAVVLLVLEVLPGPDVLFAGHVAACWGCVGFFLLAQGARKLGPVSPEVLGVEWSEVG